MSRFPLTSMDLGSCPLKEIPGKPKSIILQLDPSGWVFTLSLPFHFPSPFWPCAANVEPALHTLTDKSCLSPCMVPGTSYFSIVLSFDCFKAFFFKASFPTLLHTPWNTVHREGWRKMAEQQHLANTILEMCCFTLALISNLFCSSPFGAYMPSKTQYLSCSFL